MRKKAEGMVHQQLEEIFVKKRNHVRSEGMIAEILHCGSSNEI
jgi:hypothetical protein